MRVYRNGLMLSSVMCLGSLIPLILNIICRWGMLPSIENLLLGVFASAFVALITYLGAYHIEKKKTIGMINKYCRDYIFEWANLVPLLVKIQSNGRCSFKLAEVMDKIKNDSNVHNVVVKLSKIHEERLYAVDGYYPIFRKERKNLTVHKLLIAFAKINCAVQYCDRAYMLNNNIAYQMEREDIEYSDDELIKYINLILQNENDEYQKFLELVIKVNTMGKAKTVFDNNCEVKCL